MWRFTAQLPEKHSSAEWPESGFCVRNSGATAVVEGVGDHGCEYMTGGRVAVIGRTGKNFAAGMSGGIAYVLDEENSLYRNINKSMISMEEIDVEIRGGRIRGMIREHVEETGSLKGPDDSGTF